MVGDKALFNPPASSRAWLCFISEIVRRCFPCAPHRRYLAMIPWLSFPRPAPQAGMAGWGAVIVSGSGGPAAEPSPTRAGDAACGVSWGHKNRFRGHQ